MAGGFVTRFAPSPTGALHLGHAFAAFQVWDAARAAGGTVLLRIEDIDAGRCRPAFEAAALEDLRWLGFDWPEPVRRQSEHRADYARALERLIAEGLVYRCFRTRRDLALSAPHEAGDVVRGGPAPDEAARLAAGAPFAWRLWLDRCRERLGARWDGLGFEADGRWVKADPESAGDVVLARKDTPTSYHLASVHDDALQGVTHVIRGEDLTDAAHVHVLLQALFGWPTPIYRHHPLVRGADGKRLAKRDGAAALATLRREGVTPEDVRTMLFGAAGAAKLA